MTDDPRRPMSGAEVAAAGLQDWRLVLTLRARFRTADFVSALALATEIAAAAEAANHHPDLDLRWGRLDVNLLSHDVGAVTSRDVNLAREISAIAARLGARSDTASLQTLELALDTADRPALAPFWRAVLGYVDGAGDDVVDPSGSLPAMWFQNTEPHDEPRQRFHLDLWVPPEVVEQRIADALAVGGELISDDEAPSFWVLADPEGNHICLCTWQDRT